MLLLSYPRSYLILLLLLLAGQARALPTSTIGRRRTGDDQNSFDNVEIVHILQNVTISGTLATECCTLVFTPVSLPDGTPGVQEVKSCSAVNDPSVCPVGTVISSPASVPSSTVDSSPTTSPQTGPSTITSAGSISISLFTTSIAMSSSIATPLIPSSSSTTSPPESTTSITPILTTVFPTSTFTSTLATPTSTSSFSGATSSPPKSSALPKVIGAFAGAAVLFLIVGATIGYLKQKKMSKEERNETIRWPDTS